MEDIDDDFGDLYADVEVQANNTFTEFTRLYTEQYDNKSKGSEPAPERGHSIAEELIQSGCDDETNKIKSVDGNGEKEVFVDNGSDSEDDLNIVLNNDDNGLSYPTVRRVNLRSGGFDDVEEEGGGDFVVAEGNGSSKNRKWVGHSQLGDGLEQTSNGLGCGDRGMGAKGGYHSQYKYIRSQTAAFTCNSKANGSLGLASYSSSPLVRGDWEDNGSNQHVGTSSAVAISGSNFSLPRHRTILDVNIDTFEWRPWRHPGADITDFFNFGFNEESWKHYCSCLEQFRHQTSTGTRKTVCEPLGPSEMKDHEVGLEHETVAQGAVTGKIVQGGRGIAVPPSKFSNGETKQLKGRAIQVKDSIVERQPSFDLRRPLDLNSDVVIQITLQDSAKDSTGSGKEEVVHMDSSAHKASETRDLGLDDNIDIHGSSSSSEDEFYRDSSEGNAKRIHHAEVPERCCQPTVATYPVSMDSDDHGSGHSSDVNRHHCRKVTDCTPVEDAEAIEASNSTKERMVRDASNTVPSIMEIESSLAERSHRWPSSSGSHCETPRDGDFIKAEKYYNHRSISPPNSVTEFRKSDISDCYHRKNYKKHYSKRKSDNFISHSRHRNSIEEDLKHYNKKLHSMSKLRGNMQDDYDASLMSNTEEYDADHSTVGHNRKKEWLHGFDYSDEEYFSYCRESELSFYHHGERLSDSQVKTSYRRKPRRKGHQLFEDETDYQLCRKLDEDEYLYDRRIPRVNEVMDGDWSSCGREHTIDEMSLLTCKESRRLVSKHSSCLENEIDARWRRKGDELQYRKRMEDDDFVMERKFRDDFIKEKFRRSVLYDDTGRDYLDSKYESNLPYARCEVKSFSRNEKNYGSCYIDLEWSRVDKDDYQRCRDHLSLSIHPYKKPHSSSGRWHDTTQFRNDLCDFKKTRRHGRLRRQILTCRDKEWLSSYSDVFDTDDIINSPDDEVHYERRRFWHSEVFDWTENRCLSRHWDDEFLAGDEFHDEMKSFSFEKTARNRGLVAKHGSGHGRKLIEDSQVQQHRYKMPREGNNGIPIDRSFNITSRGNYEKTFPRCRDSVDLPLVVGEGKSSGGFYPAGSFMCNGRHDRNMDRIVYNKQKIARYSNESYKEKAGQSENQEVEITQNDEKWHDKFPVTQHNEALDIEEGQIITEESDIVEECGSEAVVPISYGKQRTLCNENAPDGKKVEENGNHRILEMLAKMEKRRERFKEPIGLKKEIDKIPKPVVETAETQRQRPLRKRSWGGR